MKTTIHLLAIAVSFAIASSALAQAPPATTDHAHAADQPAVASTIDVAAGAEAAVAVIDAFGKALAAADFEEVKALLDPAVIILETGGAERSRSEYLSHHARSDAKFLAGSHSALSRRIARLDGDTVWVASESELHASKDGKPMTLLSTETMVLNNTPAGWKIVHIHWSSRPKK
jgi:ketosteroid isomerase-like protein